MANTNKITAVKIKQQDGSYSEAIPVGVQAQNVSWDNTRNIKNILGQVNITKGNIQKQIDDLNDIRGLVQQASEDWLDEHLNNGTLTGLGLGDGDVTTSKIADGAVTTIKIANGAITMEKFASNAFLTPAQIQALIALLEE